MTHLWSDIFSILFAVSSVFLIFIVLLQRGRGGGLAGAFGATGDKAPSEPRPATCFTRITIGIAVVWVALAGTTLCHAIGEHRTDSMRRPPKSRGSSRQLPPSGSQGRTRIHLRRETKGRKAGRPTKGAVPSTTDSMQLAGLAKSVLACEDAAGDQTPARAPPAPKASSRSAFQVGRTGRRTAGRTQQKEHSCAVEHDGLWRRPRSERPSEHVGRSAGREQPLLQARHQNARTLPVLGGGDRTHRARIDLPRHREHFHPRRQRGRRQRLSAGR